MVPLVKFSAVLALFCVPHKTLMKILLLAVVLSKVTHAASARPPAVVKDFALAQCTRSGNFPGSVYFILDSDGGRWCCECPKGFYVEANCSNVNPLATQCHACPPGFYASETNHNENCTKLDTCDHLPNTRILRGNATENNKCLCIRETYSADPSVSGCKNHFKCPKGFGVETLGNSSHDTTCKKCSEGWCSDEKSSTQRCQECKNVMPDSNITSTSANTISSKPVTTVVVPTSSFEAETSGNCEPWIWICVGMACMAVIVIFIAIVLYKQGKIKWIPKRQNNQSDLENGIELEERQRKRIHRNNKDRGESAKRLLYSESDADEAPRKDSRADSSIPDKVVSKQSADAFNDADESIIEKSAIGELVDHVEEEPDIVDEAVPDNTKDDDPKSKNAKLVEDDYKKVFRDVGCEIAYGPDEDCDCQFAAAAYMKNPALSREEVRVEAKEIRRDVVKYIKDNMKHFRKNIHDWDMYIKKMSQNGYGDEFTLMALRECYGICLEIVHTSNIERFSRSKQPQEGLLLGCVDEDGGMYYVCLRRIVSGDGDCAKMAVSDNRTEEVSSNPQFSGFYKQLTEEGYRRIFLDRGYRIIYDPPKDGHCQFTSIAYLLCENKPHDQIRNEIVEYMKVESDHFCNFVDNGWDTYINNMSQNKYGDNLTLQAAHQLYRIDFEIIQTSSPQPLNIPENRNSQTAQPRKCLLLGHIDEHHGMHYVCLERIPRATSPAADSQVEIGAHDHANLSPSRLNGPTSSERDHRQAESDTRQGSESEQVVDMPAAPQVGVNGQSAAPSIGTANRCNANLEVFVHDGDRQVLLQFSSVLDEALQSEDFRRCMLQGRFGLQPNITTSDLRDFIRKNQLLNDVQIEDTEKEYERDQGEIRAQLLKKIAEKEGRRLTPKRLLKVSSEYVPRKIYDVLCKAFIERIKEVGVTESNA